LGPVLAGFIHQVVNSINNKNIVDILECLGRIEIPAGYNAYQKSVNFYSSKLKNKLRDDGVVNLNPILRSVKEDTIS